ncbi:MAG TPA: hypothetical protein VLB01_00475 [Thermodesulfobacteriota bacterium]|nr:hypothetical protein [Thermodesulfobacteriota bacterium]
MNSGRVVLYIGLLLIVGSITGCMYVRLLKLKAQLSNFDKYFELKDEQKLTMVFLEPVLLNQDIVWLLKSDPISKEETEGGEVWTYVFEKQYAGVDDDKEDFDIPVDMLFHKKKLKEVRFPERFLKYLSKPLLAKMFRSMGDAEISKLSRTADSEFKGNNPLEIPTKGQIIELLGVPFSVDSSDGKSKLTYKYKVRETTADSNNEEFRLTTKYVFQQGSDKLLKAEGDLNGLLNMSMDFSIDGSGMEKDGNDGGAD